MTDIRDGFTEFFSQVTGGKSPYSWQYRLLDFVLATGRWPEVIDAPTGAGKTSAILVHTFANSVAGGAFGVDDAVRQRLNMLPRRMAVMTPRRALVDDQLTYSLRIQEALTGAGNSGAVSEVLSGLDTRSGGCAESPFVVTSLRGGMTRQARTKSAQVWRLNPTACTVIHLTPDMFGSGLLFRRYGATASAWPMEAGLLAVDTVAMVDEAHLAQQVTATARRVEALEGDLIRNVLGRPPLQVVATTATWDKETKDGDTARVGVEDQDLTTDVSLARRLLAHKPVTTLEVSSPLDEGSAAKVIASALVEMIDAASGTVGCIVNTRATALAIAKQLRDSRAVAPDAVVTLVGRMRPFDRQELDRHYPGIFSERGCPAVKVLVATQTLEVGADIDLTGLVTELAPVDALVQRAGRVNRTGRLASAPIVVAIPPENTFGRGVYDAEELIASRKWLADLDAEAGLSPWTTRRHAVPLRQLRRPVLQRLERWDVEFFSHTSENLQAEQGQLAAGVELWIHDETLDTQGLDVLVAARDLPLDDSYACELLRLTPPNSLEYFPATLWEASNVVKSLVSQDAKGSFPRRFFVKNRQTGSFAVRRAVSNDAEDRAAELRPGDVVVVDAVAPVFRDGVLWGDESGVPTTDVHGQTEALLGRTCGVFALSTTQLDSTEPLWTGTTIVTVNPRLSQRLLTAYGDQQDADGVDSILNLLQASLPPGPLADFLSPGSDASGLMVEKIGGDGTSASDVVFVVVHSADEDNDALREVRAARGGVVLLSDHEDAVADRAEEFASILELPDVMVQVLRSAGRMHDEGKKDMRFQRLLHRDRKDADLSVPLAKSATRSWIREREFRVRNGLREWRHEQLSAAYAYASFSEAPEIRDVVTRLVGTSHGKGRATFAHASDFLLRGTGSQETGIREAAGALFDIGEWETLIEETEHRWGYWTLAYLEALLRVSDITVSREGN